MTTIADLNAYIERGRRQTPPDVSAITAAVRTARHLIGSGDEAARAEHRRRVEELARRVERDL